VPAVPIVSRSYYLVPIWFFKLFYIQPDTIVVNVGDLLARWSNDVLRSTLHRVVAPTTRGISETKGLTPARESIAFFCNPNFSAEVSCLPNCGDVPKYPPVNTGDYIVGRLAATYT
jgi:isopenicillin N synthase-like dioxygenase